MCCGNKTKRALPPQQQRASRSGRAIPQGMQPDIIIGAEGMTALEYQLTKAGPCVYRGAVTNQTYVFGGKHIAALVDNRDVPGFISRIEDRRHAFAYAQNVLPIPAPAPEVKAEPAPNGKHEIVTEPIKEEVIVEPEQAPVFKETTTKPKRGRKSKNA